MIISLISYMKFLKKSNGISTNKTRQKNSLRATRNVCRLFGNIEVCVFVCASVFLFITGKSMEILLYIYYRSYFLKIFSVLCVTKLSLFCNTYILLHILLKQQKLYKLKKELSYVQSLSDYIVSVISRPDLFLV